MCCYSRRGIRARAVLDGGGGAAAGGGGDDVDSIADAAFDRSFRFWKKLRPPLLVVTIGLKVQNGRGGKSFERR